MAATELGFYDFTLRAAKRHCSELRDLTGWHECTKTDLVKLVSQLVDVIWHDERREEQVRAELLRQMREDLSEPPTAAQIDTVIRSAHRPPNRPGALNVADATGGLESLCRALNAHDPFYRYSFSVGQDCTMPSALVEPWKVRTAGD